MRFFFEMPVGKATNSNCLQFRKDKTSRSQSCIEKLVGFVLRENFLQSISYWQVSNALVTRRAALGLYLWRRALALDDRPTEHCQENGNDRPADDPQRLILDDDRCDDHRY